MARIMIIRTWTDREGKHPSLAMICTSSEDSPCFRSLAVFVVMAGFSEDLEIFKHFMVRTIGVGGGAH